MRNKNKGLRQLVILFTAFLCSFAFFGMASAETPLEGAWLLTETQDAEGNVDSSPLRGLLVFTSTHYSIMYATGEKPRALMDEEDPSDEQTIKAYESIIANSGRYDVEGDRFMTRAYVAKYPNYMDDWPENVTTFSYSLNGDVLTIKADGGPDAGTTQIYRRVEGSPRPWE
jgi:hypothetical protein